MSDIDPQVLRDRASEYADREAFALVEAERLETLPAAFRGGSFLWKDCEWIVRWYGRRPLDGDPHPAERSFRNNRMRAVEDAIEGMVAGTSTTERLEALLALEGLSVPVASAFLQFFDPETYAVMTERTWSVLVRHGYLEQPYPHDPAPSEYEGFLRVCRDLALASDLEVAMVERALWRLSKGRS